MTVSQTFLIVGEHNHLLLFFPLIFFVMLLFLFPPPILFRFLVRWPISSATLPTLLLKRYIYAVYDTLWAPQQHARLITNPSERPFAFSQLTIDDHASMIKDQL